MCEGCLQELADWLKANVLARRHLHDLFHHLRGAGKGVCVCVGGRGGDCLGSLLAW